MTKRFLKQAVLLLRTCRLSLRGVEIHLPRYLGPEINCRTGFNVGQGHIQIGPYARIEQGVVFHAFGGSIRLGRDVFVGPYSVLYGHGGIEIGDDALISMHCRIVSSEHTIPARTRSIRWETDISKPTRIGRDVWLGAGVTVLGGVEIGDGCVIGAGAVVSHNIPPFSIAWGVPARVARTRD